MTRIAVTTAGEADREAVDWAATSLHSVLGAEVVRIDPFPEPAYAFDVTRRQYSSTLVLRDSLPRKPEEAAKLLVITEADIFIPMLSFVYGQAQLSGPVAVVSLARLRQEFYSLPPNRPLFLLRVRKEVLHEVGHAFGLTHCSDPLCTMTLSTSIQQLDYKQGSFCDDCTVLLGEAVQRFDAGGPSESGV